MTSKAFIEQQNKFRGLVSEYRSRRFVKGRTSRTSCRFRSRLRDLLLDTRVVLHKSQFDDFLSWVNHQMEVQVADIAQMPIGYDELRGVYTKAPLASLESELLWITARIKANAAKFNDFRLKADEVECLVFTGKFSDAIEILGHCLASTILSGSRQLPWPVLVKKWVTFLSSVFFDNCLLRFQ